MTSAFGLIVVGAVIAGAVVAMMTFASKPTTSVAGQSLTSSGETQGMSGDMPGMSGGDGHSEAAVANRPLTPVLGTFGGGTSAVMLAAGLLRRRDRARDLAKKAGRALEGARNEPRPPAPDQRHPTRSRH